MPAAPPKLHPFDPRAQLVEPFAVGDERLRPGRAFEAEAGGQRLLQMGAPGHHGGAVAVGLVEQGGEQGGDLGLDQGQPVAELEHRGGVHDVLGGGAPMGPGPGGAGGAGEFGDQPDHRIADVAGAGGEHGGVQVLEPRGGRDGGRGVAGDQAEMGLHPGERGLHVQHALEVGGLVEHGAHGVGAVEGAEDRAVGGVGGHGTFLAAGLRR